MGESIEVNDGLPDSTIANGQQAQSLSVRARLAKDLLLFTFLATLLIVFLNYVIKKLSVDPDENYYILGSALALRGKVPYRDFFFPQMPLSAYVFGLWQKAYGHGCIATRTLCVVLTTATGLVMFHIVRREAGLRSGLIALAFYGTSIHVIQWLPRAKTFSLSSLLMLVALLFITKETLSIRQTFVASLLAGLSLSARLLFAPFALVVGLVILVRIYRRGRWLRYLLCSALGVALGLLPTFILWLMAPDAFMFDNLRYHSMREGASGLVGDWSQKFLLLRLLLGGQEPTYGPQFLIVFPLCLAGIYRFMRSDQRLLAFPLSAVAVFVVSFLPTPTWDQYMAPLAPVIIITFSLLYRRDRGTHQTIQVAMLLPFAFVGWLWFKSNIIDPLGPLGPEINDRVGHVVREVTRSGDRLATKSFGAIGSADRAFTVCSFNVFSYGDWSRLEPAQVKRYHLCTDEMMIQDVLSGTIRAFVAGGKNELGLPEQLQARGWRSIEEPPTTIWVAP